MASGRGAFGSRFGFILAAVGSAVGLGNLWRFPYQASTNGGAVFMLIYLALLFLIGLPALMAELSLGRRSRRNAVDAFNKDGKTKPWTGVGILGLSTAILLLSYYSVIAGWALRYFFEAATVPYFDDAAAYFGSVAVNPSAILFHFLFMAITVAIVWRGVSGGIEKANLVMMPALFATVIALVLYGNFVAGDAAGRAAGREFYLRPDFGEFFGGPFSDVAATLSDAAGQTFFSIGLGLGTMLTYSSYLSRDNNLQTTGLTIGFADTGVAILAGFMVFPLMFSLGLADIAQGAGDSSVGGLFIAVPTAFAAIGGAFGQILAGLFFLMLSFAALSSAISLLEVPVSALVDRTGWGRPRSVLLVGFTIYLLGLAAAVSLTALDVMDKFVSNVLLLGGGLLLAIYVGWIRPEYLDEMTFGSDGRFDWSAFFRPVIKFVLPVLLVVLLAFGVKDFFDFLAAL